MDSKNPSGAKGRAEVYDWIQCIIFALVFCVLLFVFAVRMVNVVGHSMVPTLEQSDKVVISNLFYHPKQGDIVVLRKRTLMEEPIVKRIIREISKLHEESVRGSLAEVIAHFQETEPRGEFVIVLIHKPMLDVHNPQ